MKEAKTKETFFRRIIRPDAGRSEDSPPGPDVFTPSPSSSPYAPWRRRPSIWPSASRSPATPDTPISPPISPEEELAGLGLHLLKSPDFPLVDIIFVHGLGGHSQKTWCKDHNPELFWPELWLPLEPGLGSARILTFGYNANWSGVKRTVTSIPDFASQLHQAMKYSDVASKGGPKIGENPVIFVVHSMGGLVVKKLLGLAHDEIHSNRAIFDAIQAIVFLSTPHSGTDLAGTLNKILSVSFGSSRQYIAQLEKHSPFIMDINRQFTKLSKKLALWTFYETLGTRIGAMSTIIVDEASSRLGHPDENCWGLNADHHGVCKYAGVNDNNYKSVTGAIKSLVSGLRGRKHQQSEDVDSIERTTDINDLFRNCPSSEADYDGLWKRYVPGTCDWFVERPDVGNWLKTDLQPRLLWYHDLPGRGKSVLASFMINKLRSENRNSHCFFFQYANSNKNTVVNCLRSLALQLAKTLPSFKTLLTRAPPQSLGLDSDDAYLVWQKVFEKGLFTLQLSNPVYWVIDGLDESDSPRTLVEYLASVLNTSFPAKVLIIGRNMDNISRFLDDLRFHDDPSRRHLVPCIGGKDAETAENGIRLFLERKISSLPGGAAYRAELAKIITRQSEGSFLWTRLVLNELEECYSPAAAMAILREVPRDMTALYQRMERMLVTKTSPQNMPLISTLLTWITYAQRPMSFKELGRAIEDRFLDILLRDLVKGCNFFVLLGSLDKETVTILHHTAREYLTKNSESRFYAEPRRTHRMLYTRMLRVLQEEKVGLGLKQYQQMYQHKDPFVFFAAVNWPYHLGHSNAAASADSMAAFLDIILPFLRTQAVLNWIYIVALIRRLELLIRTAKVLTTLVSSARTRERQLGPLLHQRSDIDEVGKWAVDLVKIVGKFGHNLIAKPSVIYDIIPALCPTASMMHARFYDPHRSKIRIVNGEGRGWNARFGRLVVPENEMPTDLACSGNYVAVQGSNHVVTVWDAVGFDEVCTIKHGEIVTAICLNESGSRLATYGLFTTKIWSIPSGRLWCVTHNPSNAKAKVLAFCERDHRLFSVCDDSVVRYLVLNDNSDRNNNVQGASEWLDLYPWMLKEDNMGGVSGSLRSTPAWIEFNSDCSQVAVSYRSAPLNVYNVDDGRCIGILHRARGVARPATANQNNWFGVKRFTWNGLTGHVLGIYKEGTLFKWHPLKGDNEEVVATSRGAVDGIAVSPNGQTFVTSSSDGSIRLWNFETFRVIYRLSSEDLVIKLVFSPNGRRFYDIRSEWINAWEPDCLLGPVDGNDITSDSSGSTDLNSQMSALSVFEEEEIVIMDEPVTALAVSPDGQAYCVGYGSGRYSLCFRDHISEETEAGRLGTLEVGNITWNKRGDMLALVDLGRNVQIKALQKHITTTTSTKPSSRLEMELRSSLRIDSSGYYSIEELMFSPDSKRVFISTGANIYLFSVDDGAPMAQTAIEQQQHQQQSPRQWLCWGDGPNTCLLSFSKDGIEAFDWHTLKRLDSEALRHEAVATAATVGKDKREAAVDFIGAVMAEPPSFLLGDVLAALTGSVHYESTKADVTVETVMRTQDKKHILLLVSVCPRGATGKQKEVAGSPPSSPSCRELVVLPDSRSGFGPTVSSSPLLAQSLARVVGLIKVPLGVLPNRHLVFLDKNLWLCSVPLSAYMVGSVDQYVQKFCFIPGDWVSSDSLSMCFMAQDGAVFWPRDETVEIIESDVIRGG